MPPPPPSNDGHVGYLTDSQTVTLKELWVLLLDVFDGVLDQFTLQPTPAVYPSPPSSTASGTPVPPGSGSSFEGGEYAGKSKKKRLGKLRSAVKSRVGGGGSSPSNRATANETGSSGEQLASVTADLAPEQLLDAFFRFVQDDHPDSIVLRFMRARKWDTVRAAHMILNTIRWRVGIDSDEIIATGEESLDHRTFECGKSYIHGVDYYGRPVVYIHTRKHKAGELPLEELQRFTIWAMETTRLLVEPPGETAAMVFDLTDFTMSNMDFPYIKFLVQCFEAYYPESLGMLLIYNAPWVFSGVWKLISQLLDPVVASKIYFVKNVDDLANYIPAENILPLFWSAEKGGEKRPPVSAAASAGLASSGGKRNPNTEPHAQDTYEYAYVPPAGGENPDPEAAAEERAAAERERSLAERRFERATRVWCGSARAASTLCLSGRDLDDADACDEEEDEGGSDPEGRRELAASAFRSTWWKLDPYVRARTLYHRIGVIRKDGDGYVSRWYS